MRASMFGNEYDFYPGTYLFPKDKARLKKEWKQEVLIVKPEASC